MIKLISPNGEGITLNYYEVLDFCKVLCYKKENKEKFLKFSKDYTYFLPYFDFVMFELGYKMHNVLFEDSYLIAKSGELYLLSDLQKNNHIPFMTKCSDEVLNIRKNTRVLKNSLVDPNGMAMMCKLTTSKNGSHTITGNTIMNQLLIQNKIIYKYCHKFRSNSVNMLINLGFVRTCSRKYGGLIIGIKDLLDEQVLKTLNTKKIKTTKEATSDEFKLKEEYIKITNNYIRATK